MTTIQALLQLESCGCCFSLTKDRKIHAVLPGNRPASIYRLLDDVRAGKEAAVQFLAERAQGATVLKMEEQTTKTSRYLDIKALKLAQDAGDIEMLHLTYHKRAGLFIAVWRPITPPPFLNLDKYKKTLESRLEALLAMKPTEEVAEEYNLLALDFSVI
jgi:hypothetical protein